MKIIHLSDLHLGKRVNEFPMIEDQEYILKKILTIINEESPDAVVIAGDVYDKPIPPVEAVTLFDDFLTSLMKKHIYVFVISGNHDSAERVSFGSKLMEASNVYFAPAYNGTVSPITLKDKYGDVNFYLLPFIKPATVRSYFENEEINSYTDAMSLVIKEMNIDTSKRNILVAHQFVTGAETGGSEEVFVGGLDNIDAAVFKDFDYVALGHIHRQQNVCSEKICYSGTPLKYSFSECNHKKSLKIVTFNEKKNGKTETEYNSVPLIPLRDMRELKGKYNDLMLKANYENTNLEDYIHITLTDEEDIINGFSRLQTVYKNLMKLDYDNTRTRSNNEIESNNNQENLGPLDLFKQFYNLQNNQEMSEEQGALASSLIEKIWEGEE